MESELPNGSSSIADAGSDSRARVGRMSYGIPRNSWGTEAEPPNAALLGLVTLH